MVKELSEYLTGGRLLWLLPDPISASRPGLVDKAAPALRRLEAVETGRKRYAELRTRGVRKELAAQTAGSTHGPGASAVARPSATPFPTPSSTRSGFPVRRQPDRSTRRTAGVRTRTHGGVTGKAREGLPMSISVRLQADPVTQMNRKGRYHLTGRPVPIPVCRD